MAANFNGPLAVAYIRLRADASGFLSDLKNLKGMTKTIDIKSGGSNAGKSWGNAFVGSAKRILEGSMSTMLGILGAAGFNSLSQTVTDFTKSMVMNNAELEKMKTSLDVLFQSKSIANRMFADVKKMAAETPFETPDLIRGIQLLKQFGHENEKLIPLMRSIGDAAAASPMGMTDAVHRMTYAFGQIKTAGKLLGQDMRQLTEVGVPAVKILEEQFGKSFDQIQKDVTDGKITIDQALEAITAGMDKRFGGMMAKQSKSFLGLMSTVRDEWFLLVAEWGKPLFKEAKIGIESLLGLLRNKDFQNAGKRFGEGLAYYVRYASGIWKSAFDSIRSGVNWIANNQSLQSMAKTLSQSFGKIREYAIGIGNNFTKIISPVMDNIVRGASSLVGKMLSLSSVSLKPTMAGVEDLFRLIEKYTNDLPATFELAWTKIKIQSMTGVLQIVSGIKTVAFAFVQTGTVIINTFRETFSELTKLSNSYFDSFQKQLNFAKKLASGTAKTNDWQQVKDSQANLMNAIRYAKNPSTLLAKNMKTEFSKIGAFYDQDFSKRVKASSMLQGMLRREIELQKQINMTQDNKEAMRSKEKSQQSFLGMYGAVLKTAQKSKTLLGGMIQGFALGIKNNLGAMGASFLSGNPKVEVATKITGDTFGIAEFQKQIQRAFVEDTGKIVAQETLKEAKGTNRILENVNVAMTEANKYAAGTMKLLEKASFGFVASNQ